MKQNKLYNTAIYLSGLKDKDQKIRWPWMRESLSYQEENKVKIYYDKSTNGEILFYIGTLIFAIFICGLNEWINVLIAVGWIPIFLIIICIIRRRSYYIKRENDKIVFVKKIKVKSITKKELVTLEKNKVIDYYIDNQKLIILTQEQKHTIEDFHIKLSKIEQIFG